MATNVLTASARISATDETGDVLARIGAKIQTLSKTAKAASTEFTAFAKGAGAVGAAGAMGGAVPRRAGEEGGFLGGLGSVGEMLKGMVTFNIAAATVNIAKTVVSTAADLIHEELMWKAASGKPEDFAELKDQAEALGKTYGLPQAEILKSMRELYATVGTVEETKALIEPFTQLKVIATAAHPERKGEINEEFAKLAKMTELKGITQDHDRFVAAMDNIAKALNLFSSTLKPEDYFQMQVKARGAGLKLSDQFMLGVGPTIAQEMGGAAAGTALAAFSRQFVAGKMETREVRELKQLGLVKPGAEILNAQGVITGIKEGGIVGQGLAARDPYAWTQKYLKQALERAGYESDDAKLMAVSRLSSNRMSEQLTGVLLTQQKRIEKDLANLKPAAGLESALEFARQDPEMAKMRAEANATDIAARKAVGGVKAATEKLTEAADTANELDTRYDAYSKAQQEGIVEPEWLKAREARRGGAWHSDLARERAGVARWEPVPEVPPQLEGWPATPPPLLPWPEPTTVPELNRAREERFPQFRRGRGIAPAAQLPGAGIGGKAEMDVKVTAVPTDDFWTKIDTRINSAITNFRFTGAPNIGTTGQTGYSMPEVHPENE